MGRLTIDMTDGQHQSLKAQAVLRGIPINQYALERLFTSDAATNHAWTELKALLHTRIHEGLDGSLSNKSINQIIEEELTDGRA